MNNLRKALLYIMSAIAMLAMVVPVCAQTKGFKVVLDAGHGGKDAGAIGAKIKVREKNINLKVVLEVGRLLKEEAGIDVVYTRKKDIFIELDERPRIANRANADLFVSIHANATENRAINGFETYTLGESMNDVSVRENKVAEMEENYKSKYNLGGNSDENFIYSNMMLDAGSGGESSIKLAQMVQGKFRENTDRADRDVRQANFWVLKHILMPGVLIEIGYISNILEEKYLSEDANLMVIARSIYEAIIQYRDEMERKSQPLIDEDVASIESANAETTTKPASKTNEIYYRVQMFSSTKKLQPTSPEFKKFTPAFEYKDGNLYKYMYGSAQTFKDAQLLKQKVKLSFPDAFVVVFKGETKLSGEEARKYMK